MCREPGLRRSRCPPPTSGHRGSLLRPGAGLLVGLGAAAVLTRFMDALLFGVEPGDPATFAAVSAFLLAVALFASWLPARRAARVDPAEALRAE